MRPENDALFLSAIFQRNSPVSGIFKRRDLKSPAVSKSKTKIMMKNLPKDIVFLTDGHFDFNDGLWKSGGRNIRKVY